MSSFKKSYCSFCMHIKKSNEWMDRWRDMVKTKQISVLTGKFRWWVYECLQFFKLFCVLENFCNIMSRKEVIVPDIYNCNLNIAPLGGGNALTIR